MPTPPDRFDEIRRKWIARYQHGFTFQKRRQEVLARQIRDRAWEKTGARVDPADDDVIHSLFRRGHTTVYALQGPGVIGVLAIAAPMGWPLGRRSITALFNSFPRSCVPIRSRRSCGRRWRSGPRRCSTAQATRGQRPWSFLDHRAGSRGISGSRHLRHPGRLAGRRRGRVTGGPMRPPEDHDVVDFGLHPDDLTMPPTPFSTIGEAPLGERTPIRRDAEHHV